MTTDDLPPEPLVADGVDLRDYAFMPLDVVRLRDSGLSAKATGDEFRAAVLLWCASWHQIPAASLPDDDLELANLCGYSRAMREWSKVRDGALRGWIKCSDGRLYHPTVAEKARESWARKLAHRARTESARKAREQQRQKQLQSQLQSMSQNAKESVTDNVTESKRQGQGQGQGQGQNIKPLETFGLLSGSAAPSPDAGKDSDNPEKPDDSDNPEKPDDPAKAARTRKANAEAAEVLSFLNRATGSRFQPVEANLRLIRGRLAEYDVATAKRVIADRWERWADDPKMAEFLRPATLFAASNFANYAGQLPPIPEPTTPQLEGMSHA